MSICSDSWKRSKPSLFESFIGPNWHRGLHNSYDDTIKAKLPLCIHSLLNILPENLFCKKISGQAKVICHLLSVRLQGAAELYDLESLENPELF